MRIDNFVARKEELESLEELYLRKSFELPIIYGRRRIGKSTLINHFIYDKPVIYFQAFVTSISNNLSYLSKRIDEFKTGRDNSNITSYVDLRSALIEVNEIAKESTEKIVFVIDEYPYLAESDSSISSILQEVIDHHYKYNNKLMLILCGSSMSFMEKQVLGSKSPLYGRRTAQYKLLPFTIFDTYDYFQDCDINDVLVYHGITGGIPQYLEYINPTLTVRDNIQNLFLRAGAPLLEEPENLLNQELRNPATYNSILYAIANGKSKYNEIQSVIDVGSGTITTYLHNLIDLGLIEKKISFQDKKAKKPIYVIKDGLFRFWHRFIDGNLERISMRRTSSLLDRIMDELPQFLGYTFESATVDWLWIKSSFDFEPSVVKSWWGNNPIEKKEEEIDIVVVDEKYNNGIIGECKWRTSQNMELSMIDALMRRSTLVPEIRNKKLVFFVRECKDSFETYASENDIMIIKYESFFNE